MWAHFKPKYFHCSWNRHGHLLRWDVQLRMAQRKLCLFKSEDMAWSVRIYCSSRHPKDHRNISEEKILILSHPQNFLCPVRFMTTGSFQFCRLLWLILLCMSLNAASLELKVNGQKIHSYINTAHNKEFTLKAGSAWQNLKSKNPTVWSCEIGILKGAGL